MLKHSYFKIYMVSYIAICLSNNTTYSNHLGSLYTSGWHLIEDIVITQPQEASNSWSNKGIKILSTIAATWGTHKACGKLLEYFHLPLQAQQSPGYQTVKSLVGIGAGITSYLSIMQAIKQKNEIACFKEFITQWPSYKAYAPKEIRLCLDELYDLHGKNSLSHHQIKHAIRLLKLTVKNKFPDTYASKKYESFFDFRKFEADAKFEAGNFLRGVADLWRASTGR